MLEQIEESDSYVEGEYFFPVIACPKTEAEAADLKKLLDEDKSMVAVDASPLEVVASESFGPNADLGIRLQDSSFFDETEEFEQVTKVDQ